jgi:DNA mismatch repair protein MSH3
MRSEIESQLLYARPSDLLVVTPISINTRRLLDSYCKSSSGVKITEVDGSKYANGGYSASLTKYFCPVPTTATRGDDNQPLEKLGKSILEKILEMPPVVGQALAHCLDYLAPFGLDNLIQQPEQIANFSDVQEMTLSPNCIEQLEILRNSDDGAFYGSLLWLLDKTQTRFGARLLRRWVCKPLKDANMIKERLEAVEEIVKSGMILVDLLQRLHSRPVVILIC